MDSQRQWARDEDRECARAQAHYQGVLDRSREARRQADAERERNVYNLADDIAQDQAADREARERAMWL